MNFFGKKEKKFQIPIQNVAQQMQAPQPIHGGGGGQMGQLMQQGQIFGPQQLVCGPNQTKNEFFWGKNGIMIILEKNFQISCPISRRFQPYPVQQQRQQAIMVG